jgi:hypothetical protein
MTHLVGKFTPKRDGVYRHMFLYDTPLPSRTKVTVRTFDKPDPLTPEQVRKRDNSGRYRAAGPQHKDPDAITKGAPRCDGMTPDERCMGTPTVYRVRGKGRAVYCDRHMVDAPPAPLPSDYQRSLSGKRCDSGDSTIPKFGIKPGTPQPDTKSVAKAKAKFKKALREQADALRLARALPLTIAPVAPLPDALIPDDRRKWRTDAAETLLTAENKVATAAKAVVNAQEADRRSDEYASREAAVSDKAPVTASELSALLAKYGR